jgi:hypothetical protein
MHGIAIRSAIIIFPENCTASTVMIYDATIAKFPCDRFVRPMIPKIRDIPKLITAYSPPSKTPFTRD